MPGSTWPRCASTSPGDDVRRIDWNVTARTTIPHVREYHEDREITAWFLLDLSPSVDFGTVDDGRVKRTQLVDFTATLARLLTRRGNRVGAMLFASKLDRTIPAAGGRAQVLRLVRDLQAEPHLDQAPVTDLAALFEAAHRQIRRRSMVVIVSDFISAPGWEKPLHLLNRRHEVLAVRLEDPRESELPDVGPIVVQDSETGEQLVVDTHDAAFRARFAEAATARRDELARAFGRAGVDARDPVHRGRPRPGHRAHGRPAQATAAEPDMTFATPQLLLLLLLVPLGIFAASRIEERRRARAARAARGRDGRDAGAPAA